MLYSETRIELRCLKRAYASVMDLTGAYCCLFCEWWICTTLCIKNIITSTMRVSLKQLERLRSEDPHRLMINHSIDAYWIPSRNKTKSTIQIFKNAKISNCCIFKTPLHAAHLLKLLDKIGNMKWIRQSLLKIQSGQDSVHSRIDGQGVYSLLISLKRGYKHDTAHASDNKPNSSLAYLCSGDTQKVCVLST